MRNTFFFALAYFALISISQAQLTNNTTTVNGDEVRIHLVQKGETLFGLSRIYEVEVSDLAKLNPKATEGLSIGQKFYVPIKKNVVTSSATSKKHTVKAGETLFSISRAYNISVEEIKKTNNLTSNELNVDQELIIGAGKVEENPTIQSTQQVNVSSGDGYVVKAGETLFAISRQTGVSLDNLMKWNNLSSSSISEGQVLVVKDPSLGAVSQNKTTDQGQNVDSKENVEEKADKGLNTTEKNTQNEEDNDIPPPVTNVKDEPIDEFVEVMEKGVAELIPDTNNTRKYLALHRTVKPGTIIRVRNDMNGKEVWARVIGPLPDTGDNKDILLKISKAAYDRLGALDKKFRVTITYIP